MALEFTKKWIIAYVIVLGILVLVESSEGIDVLPSPPVFNNPTALGIVGFIGQIFTFLIKIVFWVTPYSIINLILTGFHIISILEMLEYAKIFFSL